MCTSLTNEVPVILREIEKFTQTFYIAHVEFGSMTGLGNFFNTAGPNCLESVLNLAITDVMMIDQDDLAILMELRNLPNLITLGFRKKHSGGYRDPGWHEGKHFVRKMFKFAHSWLKEVLENGKEMDFSKLGSGLKHHKYCDTDYIIRQDLFSETTRSFMMKWFDF